MKEKKSLGINAFLNAIKSSLSVLFPIIIYPYVFRVLHSENMGKIDFAFSVVSYFSYIGSLGVAQYAVREGAKVRDNRLKFEQLTSEIFSINVISTLVAYSALFLVVLFTPKLHNYSLLIMISSLSIAFTTLGVDWVNTVYEDFLYTTIRSIVIHIISLILIFLLVRVEGDYYIYAAILVLNNIMVGLSNWFYCRKYTRFVLVKSLNLRTHFKPIVTLFANTLATNVYVNSDITMLGWFCGDYHVGVYSLTVKIYTAIKNILAAMYTVTIPRISFYIGKKDLISVRELYSKLVSLISLILFPAGAGIIVIAPEIVLLMGGDEYVDAVLPLQVLGISLIGAIYGGLLTYCLNVPLRRDHINFRATLISAMSNIGLNFILIPLYKQNGAAITTAISEFIVLLYCLMKFGRSITEYIEWKMVVVNIMHAVCGVISVVVVGKIVHNLIPVSIITMFLIILISVILYLLELLLLRNDFFVTVARKKVKR